ncbi:MAG: AgmX/PglI C-terminal domain-containing protein [Gemmatimonadaceae bacterium]|nr:AgmX/PglI C-terminal domain-containing protein [Gemmatimonadaceae bacterium]
MINEGRVLSGSYALASALGSAWLALVYLSPAPPPAIALMRAEEIAPVEVQFEEPEKPKAAEPEAKADEPEKAAEKAAAKEAQEIGDAFGGSGGANALVGDVTNALRGVAVAKGGSGGGGGGGAGTANAKRVIASGAAVAGPGKGAFDASVTAAGSAIGRVSATGGVDRATIRVAAPSMVRAADGGPPGRNVAQLGTFVRSRQAQLQFCYTEIGLGANPSLAGTIGVTVSLAPTGAVLDARVATRTWNGAGVMETEGCVLGKVRGWSFPPSSKDGSESYNFSFVFNK